MQYKNKHAYDNYATPRISSRHVTGNQLFIADFAVVSACFSVVFGLSFLSEHCPRGRARVLLDLRVKLSSFSVVFSIPARARTIFVDRIVKIFLVLDEMNKGNHFGNRVSRFDSPLHQ